MKTPYRFLMTAAYATLLATAADPPALSPRGKLLFSEDFSAPVMAKGWVGAPGKWEIVDGAAKAAERPEDKHAAVRRHALAAYRDAIFEFSFRFDGAKAIHLSLNQKGGHLCRLILTPKGMVLQADKPNPKSDLATVRLGVLNIPIEAGKWHQAVVEVRGARMIAQLDGTHTVSGENPRLDADKADFGFPVTGASAWLDNIKVFAVQPR